MTGPVLSTLIRHGVLDRSLPLTVGHGEDAGAGGSWHDPHCPATTASRAVTVGDLADGESETRWCCDCLDELSDHDDLYPHLGSRDTYAAHWLNHGEQVDADTARGRVARLRHLLGAAPDHRDRPTTGRELHTALRAAVAQARIVLDADLRRALASEDYLREETAHLASLAVDPELPERSRASLDRRAALGLDHPAGGFDPATLPPHAPAASLRTAHAQLTSSTSWVWTDESSDVLGDAIEVVAPADWWGTVLVRVPALIALEWADRGWRVVHDGRHRPDTVLTAVRLAGNDRLDDTCAALAAATL